MWNFSYKLLDKNDISKNTIRDYANRIMPKLDGHIKYLYRPYVPADRYQNEGLLEKWSSGTSLQNFNMIDIWVTCVKIYSNLYEVTLDENYKSPIKAYNGFMEKWEQFRITVENHEDPESVQVSFMLEPYTLMVEEYNRIIRERRGLTLLRNINNRNPYQRRVPPGGDGVIYSANTITGSILMKRAKKHAWVIKTKNELTKGGYGTLDRIPTLLMDYIIELYFNNREFF